MTPYYQDDAVTIYHGNCLEIMPRLDTVDHVITDTPYAPQTHKGARTTKGSDYSGGGVKLVTFKSITPEQLRETIGAMKFRRWLVTTTDYKFIPALDTDPPANLDFVRFGVWYKTDGGTPQITGDRPAQGWEAVAIMHHKGRKRWNRGGGPGTWAFPTVNASVYPTEKPLALVEAFVRDFTDPGDTILDPYCGSGTTLDAARGLGRKAIGIDSSEEACEISARRMRFNRASCKQMTQEVLTF